MAITGTPTHSNALVGPGFVCAGTSSFTLGPVIGGSYNLVHYRNATIASSSGISVR
ncbi:MAG: hypothetical protein IPP38_17815 [Bacteroidetes bacterium]|nr:hypothetical protein [Bacteroidota bacterium]